MIKYLIGIFLVCVISLKAQDKPSSPDPIADAPPIEIVKPIIWDKFEAATNKDGITIGGKAVDKTGKITTVSVAKDHSVALVAGKAVVTGADGAGQRDAPKDTFTSVASGYSHSIGLTEDGRVICWGYNAHNQCDVPKDIGKVIMVAAGHSFSMALDDKGKVWEWGDNGTRKSEILNELPVIIKIDASGETSIAIDADGVTYTWGGDGQPVKYEKSK
jgi:alpha-tubulin suppressor-like RCC1 family protein